eukprot:CAMPEP_0195074968 /NCGR_PEP_ID=MMETSP0448-20130528/17954_1 /TAXON_ID=66468 /ORGANISM="Heterocapsa triquestra, Strain CCMP 448" /LENGTH=87 /DNA_ID=CAMNT_0040107295 /DNA_START=108 /DNA_END=369 /DNA_ORIENTATION=-
MTDQQIHDERQYLVQYITSSAAGFYVKDVRLSMAMLLKATYFSGVCVFAFITNFISKNDVDAAPMAGPTPPSRAAVTVHNKQVVAAR